MQRPGIDALVETDLRAIRTAARWLKRYRPVSRRVNLDLLYDEFSQTTRRELDFVAEGHNAEHFSQDFSADPGIRIPRVYWETTSRRVLTMQNVAAIKIGDHVAIEAAAALLGGGPVTQIWPQGGLVEGPFERTLGPAEVVLLRAGPAPAGWRGARRSPGGSPQATRLSAITGRNFGARNRQKPARDRRVPDDGQPSGRIIRSPMPWRPLRDSPRCNAGLQRLPAEAEKQPDCKADQSQPPESLG